ncbi:GNAT family N-acetyltransferase [Glaciihabitans arcticus]|uniref:GNAT family N-acetyltransferase n=1 Tax=Glaciihabitans arcticus TaxID=2668039 RepID=A0A4Q9GVK6_9MICO|nr:GNAT family N-acetyltransferase [Glaciihabitans arcticus]TBN57618.1 GNAT family N-acetyltransferase [Glaciihabitans arcticus]
MPIELFRATVAELTEVLDALRGWQRDRLPMQLHPGDLGWQWRFGAENVSEAVRVWRGDSIRAVGFLDGPGLVRLAIAPEAQGDELLIARIVDDLAVILPEGDASVEARCGAPLADTLTAAGWTLDEPWTPLERDLANPVPASGLRIEVVGTELAELRAAVHRSAFEGSVFTAERWQILATGPAYADARCVLAFDEQGAAVAAATVWSAGVGRPGLLEPVGVHADHRGRGHGTAITLAAAAALREMGASSAVVCTPSANVGAVATYVAAGFERSTEVRDFRRPA